MDSGSHEIWDKIWKKSQNKGDLFSISDISEASTVEHFWQKGYFNDLITFLGIKIHNKRFLELGCGRSSTSIQLGMLGVEDITLVDLSQTALDDSLERFKICGLNPPNTVKADVRDTMLEDNSFDCIYNIGLLEHFIDPQDILNECYRLLKKNGVIFMPIVPRLPLFKKAHIMILVNPIGFFKQAMARIYDYFMSAKTKKMIRTAYAKDYFANIAIKAGLSDVQCISYNPYPKVNKNLKIEKNVILRCYKYHYKHRKYNFFRFESSSYFENCYLLTARKCE